LDVGLCLGERAVALKHASVFAVWYPYSAPGILEALRHGFRPLVGRVERALKYIVAGAAPMSSSRVVIFTGSAIALAGGALGAGRCSLVHSMAGHDLDAGGLELTGRRDAWCPIHGDDVVIIIFQPVSLAFIRDCCTAASDGTPRSRARCQIREGYSSAELAPPEQDPGQRLVALEHYSIREYGLVCAVRGSRTVAVQW